MSLRFLAVLALVGLGCSGQDETHWVCLATCDNSVTFDLTAPIAGQQLTISVGETGGGVEHLDCQAGAGSVACLPVPQRLTPTFDANSALTSLKFDYPSAGRLDVQISADGAPAAAASFQYAPIQTQSGPCGGETCVSPQTFTIPN